MQPDNSNSSNLIPVTKREGELVADSRNLATALGIQHENLLGNLDTYRATLEAEFGRVRFETGILQTAGGPQKTRFAYLTEDQALFVATLSKNTVAVVRVKAWLVKAFAVARAALLPAPPPVPQTLGEALRLAADLSDERDRLALNVATLTPKGEFFDAVADSKTAIEMAAVAKVLDFIDVGRTKLFAHGCAARGGRDVVAEQQGRALPLPRRHRVDAPHFPPGTATADRALQSVAVRPLEGGGRLKAIGNFVRECCGNPLAPPQFALPTANPAQPRSQSAALTTGKLDTGTLQTGKLETGGLTTGGLTTGKLDTGKLTTGGLTTGGLETGKLTTGSLETGKLSTGGLTTGGLSTSKLETGGLTTGNLQTGGLQTGTLDAPPNLASNAPKPVTSAAAPANPFSAPRTLDLNGTANANTAATATTSSPTVASNPLAPPPAGRAAARRQPAPEPVPLSGTSSMSSINLAAIGAGDADASASQIRGAQDQIEEEMRRKRMAGAGKMQFPGFA